MEKKDSQLQTFIIKELEKKDQLLVLGLEESLTKTLPAGALIIDPSVSKTKEAAFTYEDKLFATEDLSNFSLNTKFHSILSLNKLHLVKDLSKVFCSIEKHLIDEAHLYFPLSCNKMILAFLKKHLQTPAVLDGQFNIRSRSDVEEAVMQAPFDSIHIEEKEEHLNFYSEDAVKAYLHKLLPQLVKEEKYLSNELVNTLCNYLYKEKRKDEVLSLPNPWILLTLCNNDEYIEK